MWNVVVKMDLEGLESLLALTDGVEVDTETVSDGALLQSWQVCRQRTRPLREEMSNSSSKCKTLGRNTGRLEGNFIPFLDTLSILSLNGHLVITDNTIAIASL
jgi:hypothetical protein